MSYETSPTRTPTAMPAFSRAAVAFGVISLILAGSAYPQRTATEPDLFSLSFALAPGSHGVTPVPIDTPGIDAAAEPAEGEPTFTQRLEAVEEIEQAIVDEEALNGPQSGALIDHLTSLAAAYQALGDTVLALAALERARQIVRVNEGLHSLDQVPMVEQAIDMLEAAGQYNESETSQDALLELARRNEADPRVASVLAAVAERQMAVVEAYLEQGWTRSRVPIETIEGSMWEPNLPAVGLHKAGPQLGVIANDYDSAIEQALTGDDYAIGDPLDLETSLEETYALIDKSNDCIEVGGYGPGIYRCDPVELERESFSIPEMTDRELALSTLHRARRLYSAAMQAALAAGSYGEFLELEERVVETHYLERAHPQLHSRGCYSSCAGFRNPELIGTLESVLRARVVDRLTRGASPVEVARAIVELGDSYKNLAALEQYQNAHDFLVKEGVPAETIEALFSPETPVVRRAFPAEDSEHFDPSRVYPGYIDVLVEIGRYGDARTVEILASTPGTPRAIERRLRRHVLKTQFRPRFVDGRPRRSDEFPLRYYYDYDPQP